MRAGGGKVYCQIWKGGVTIAFIGWASLNKNGLNSFFVTELMEKTSSRRQHVRTRSTQKKNEELNLILSSYFIP
jgi:hypothetical protein